MLLNIDVPKAIDKIKQQIKAIEFQLKQDVREKDIKIHKEALHRLKEELLYREYLHLQSKEFNLEVKGYDRLIMQDKEVAIKVNFTWGWLRVYRTKSNRIEWY